MMSVDNARRLLGQDTTGTLLVEIGDDEIPFVTMTLQSVNVLIVIH